MTYSDLEFSGQSGQPILLYQFVIGDTAFCLTNYEEAQTWGEKTWVPSAISHGDIAQSPEMNKDNLTFDLPRTESLAQEFLGYSPDAVVSVTVFRKHCDDPEGIVYWRGRVATSVTDGERVSLDCESVFTSLRRPGLRARYQRACRHSLYGIGCRLNKDDFALGGTPTAAIRNVVTVPEAASSPDGYYRGGMLAFNGIYRMVTGHSGSQLTLSRPIQSLLISLNEGAGNETVQIYPGCDHSRATCDSKFNNLNNYGGFPWIPLKNPFKMTSLI